MNGWKVACVVLAAIVMFLCLKSQVTSVKAASGSEALVGTWTGPVPFGFTATVRFDREDNGFQYITPVGTRNGKWYADPHNNVVVQFEDGSTLNWHCELAGEKSLTVTGLDTNGQPTGGGETLHRAE